MSYELFEKGMTVSKIASQRNLKEDTIYGHIQKMHQQGKPINLYDFINKEEVLNVMKAKNELDHNEESVKPIFEHLKEEIPYWKIRMGLYIAENEKN